ncbi:oligoribonuclease [Kistimonas asteriae]|uniref:oligoribonuclease n=1 Tax=Kistimonas asteriae TaxID=517724 RepID=UPI001BA49642|nr:oligoribonuclease [Kistimonas asteriae]
MVQADNLVWIDLEMTGLDPDTDRILEVATIITDGELNELAVGPVIAVHQPDSVLNAMDDWCIKTHGQTGLTDRVRKSTITEQEAEKQTLDFIRQYIDPRVSPMCGNSIGQDRRFLHRFMRDLHDYFHYRNIDVSTVKELARRWRPDVLNGVVKTGSHKALDDIRESIAEMRYYREHFIKIN